MDAKKVPKVISIASIKGGVGKSTTCLILAKLLAQKHKVLLIDMDTQASITSYYDTQLEERNIRVPHFNIHQVLKGELLIGDTVVNVEQDLDIIPSFLTLQDFIYDIMEIYRNDKNIKISDTNLFLKEAMVYLEKKYDYILIDNPPTLDPILANALLVSDYVIVPVVCELWTFESLELIHDKVRNRLKLNMPIYTIATKYKNRSTYRSISKKLEGRSDFLGIVSERESLNRSIFSKIDFDMTCDYVCEYQTIWNNFISKTAGMI
ncbi:ParA family protein [Borrelia sp. RT1S]|uniref:ParA family protein n=1 Tax=Borrelia sp. RT1S TaxID=2898580 RepID=UPI001E5F27F3|nr:ParA family protein [Borrelia sp. RT1S]UGQ17902.1 ParA family protein [Borrelia sp. RT1S]